MLSELLLLQHVLQRARCERPECAYAARTDHLQQHCKLQRLLRSHSSTVQLDAMSGDMMSCRWRRGLDGSDGDVETSTAVPLRGRLKVLFANAFEFEVVQGTVGMPDTIHTTATPCANGAVDLWVGTKTTSRSGGW